MKIKGVEFKFSQIVALFLYYSIAFYLPKSLGMIRCGGKIRYLLCRVIFKEIGENVNIERRASFGSGRNVVIGDNSGLCINCTVPSDIRIGKNVMMGPNCYILSGNHVFASTEIPMIQQGMSETKQTIIDDDVWIGRNVTMTSGRHIRKGSIIAACCVLTKDFPEYSIVGGNPSRLIRLRK